MSRALERKADITSPQLQAHHHGMAAAPAAAIGGRAKGSRGAARAREKGPKARGGAPAQYLDDDDDDDAAWLDDAAYAYADEVEAGGGRGGKKSRRKRQQSANHLLNFSYRQPAAASPAPAPHRRKGSASRRRRDPFRKERFVQANYRFAVRAGSTSDNPATLTDSDELIDWADIAIVYVQTALPLECPICLHSPTAARITRCGHVFCQPCLDRFFAADVSEKVANRCPLCQEYVHADDLKHARVEDVAKVSDKGTISLSLMQRARGSALAVPRALWGTVVNAETLLPHTHQAAKHTRVCTITDADLLAAIDCDILDLEDAASIAHAMGDPESVSDALSAAAALRSRHGRPDHLTRAPPASSDPAPAAPEPAAGDVFDDHLAPDQMLLHTTDDPPAGDAADDPQPQQPSVDNMYFTYQASDGQRVFLEPFMMRCLLHEYGSHDTLPDTIKVQVRELDSFVQSEATRRRYKVFGHVPLTADFVLCEIDLRTAVSPATVKHFAAELRDRDRRRRKKERAEQQVLKEQDILHKQEHPDEFTAFHNTPKQAPPSPADFDFALTELRAAAGSSPSTGSFLQALHASSLESQPAPFFTPSDSPPTPASLAQLADDATDRPAPSYAASVSTSWSTVLQNQKPATPPSSGKKKKGKKKETITLFSNTPMRRR